jgi:cardiolipin synthase
MAAIAANTTCNWLCTGERIFPEMLSAIDQARDSVSLESYTFSVGTLGERFRDSLVRARQRGARVRVLIDGLGSAGLPAAFWDPLKAVGGEVKIFNPLAFKRISIRDHRKLLVCDRQVAFIGGFNIAPEYEGDGVLCGWCDLGLRIEGPLANQLALSFEEMFARAEFRYKRFIRLRQFAAKRSVAWPMEQILFSGPGRGRNPIKRSLRRDLASAIDVKIMVAYFLPTRRLRRDLTRVVQRGGRVQFILAGKSDVLVSQLAGQSLYRRFLKAGVEIFEYQPQILHAKLIIIDDIVYVGSSNLDQRSLQINYELMIRFQNREFADQARAVFANTLGHCAPVTLQEWRETRSIWRRIKQRWAYFLLVHIDPFIARRQWKALPD